MFFQYFEYDVAAREQISVWWVGKKAEKTYRKSGTLLGRRADSTCMGTINVLENRRKSVI